MQQIPYVDEETGMEFRVTWEMANPETFNIKAIKKFIRNNKIAGKSLDLFPHPFKRDALEVLKELPDNSIWLVYYDPVYTDRQQKEITTYTIKGTNYKSHPEYFNALERELFRVVAPKGRVLKFMHNGKRISGFKKIYGEVIEHGGQHSCTICTVHEKIQETLF